MAALTTLNPNRRAASAYEREESRQLALYNYAKDKEKKVLDLARKKKIQGRKKNHGLRGTHNTDPQWKQLQRGCRLLLKTGSKVGISHVAKMIKVNVDKVARCLKNHSIKKSDKNLPEEEKEEKLQAIAALGRDIVNPVGRKQEFLKPSETVHLATQLKLMGLWFCGWNSFEVEEVVGLAIVASEINGYKKVEEIPNLAAYVKRFIKTHELRKVKGGNVDIKRVLAATVEKRDWFFGEVIPEALKEMNQVNATNNPDYIPIKTLDDPNFEGRVFFMDETAVDVTNGVPATIAGKEYLKFRAGKMAAGDKQPFHVTLCLTTCSSGENVIPPYVIHSTGSKNDNPDEIKLNLNDFEAFLRQENEALGINGTVTQSGSMLKGKFREHRIMYYQ